MDISTKTKDKTKQLTIFSEIYPIKLFVVTFMKIYPKHQVEDQKKWDEYAGMV